MSFDLRSACGILVIEMSLRGPAYHLSRMTLGPFIPDQSYDVMCIARGLRSLVPRIVGQVGDGD